VGQGNVVCDSDAILTGMMRVFKKTMSDMLQLVGFRYASACRDLRDTHCWFGRYRIIFHIDEAFAQKVRYHLL
jgi:hypothetical protein